ncbi:MAG: flotillin-like FloA family protein [Phycisphaera sp.]|nr:MAG: flotillin-like FloA family protein [Phycisphaera sp.]
MNPYFIGWIAGVATVLFPMVGIWFILPWIRCFVSDCPMNPGRVVGMRLRRTPVMLVCDAYIALRKSGVDVGPYTLDQLETVWLAHPGLYTTPEALIAAYEQQHTSA